jgi:hypothetical protein
MKLTSLSAVCAAALAAGIAAPAAAQHLEGDARTAVERWGRMNAPAGTFWLDNNDDREIIRYTTPRDVRLCLPEPTTTERGYPLRVTWDGANSLVLYPGNCLFFDARQVTVKPASNLPPNVVLRGRVATERALVK